MTSENRTQEPAHKGPIYWLFAIICAVGIFVTIFIMARGQATANESVLLSLILTILSTGSGWLITQYSYNEDRTRQINAIRGEYEKNIETYAVKASEKVINLSNQIGRLISYISDADVREDSDPRRDLDLLCERNKSLIHMLETIKSMNDTSLSDWEGVIGDRLDAKRQIDEQRNYDISEILDNIRDATREGYESVAVTKTDLATLVKDLKGFSQADSFLPPARAPLSRLLECPNCGNAIRMKTNSKGYVRKTAVTCLKCKAQLAIKNGHSEYPSLAKRQREKEAVACSGCGTRLVVELDNATPAQAVFSCDACSAMSIAIRNQDGVLVKGPLKAINNSTANADPRLLEDVANLLPPQPWPTGIHREIANKLETSPAQVGKIIQRLIKLGRVSDQKDGVVIEA